MIYRMIAERVMNMAARFNPNKKGREGPGDWWALRDLNP